MLFDLQVNVYNIYTDFINAFMAAMQHMQKLHTADIGLRLRYS